MTPERLSECLEIIRWTPNALAQALECDVSLVDAWLNNLDEIPIKTGAWIEAMTLAHKSAEALKPVSLRGKRFKA